MMNMGVEGLRVARQQYDRLQEMSAALAAGGEAAQNIANAINAPITTNSARELNESGLPAFMKVMDAFAKSFENMEAHYKQTLGNLGHEV